MQINILGQKFTLIKESPSSWAEGGRGRVSIQDGEIRVNENMPLDIQNSIIIHEVIHAISDINSLELTEQQVSVLAAGLFQVVQANELEVFKPFS